MENENAQQGKIAPGAGESATSRISELEAKLAAALNALQLAKSVMDFCKGDAYERECTAGDRTAFAEAYEEFFPTPRPVERFFAVREPMMPCHACARSFRGTRALFNHSRDSHSYIGEHKTFCGMYRRAIATRETHVI